MTIEVRTRGWKMAVVPLQTIHKPFSYTHWLWGSGREVGGLCWKTTHKPDHRGRDERLEARPRIPPEKDRRDRRPPPKQWKAAKRVTSHFIHTLYHRVRTRGWRMAVSLCKTIHKPFHIHNENRVQDQRLEVGGVLLQMIHKPFYTHAAWLWGSGREVGGWQYPEKRFTSHFIYTLTRGKKLNKSAKTLKPW